MTPLDNYGEKPKPLTAQDKAKWNKFIGFVEANNMKNNPVLDQRNKQVGMSLLQKFNLANPKDALPTDIVPRVQQELQDYRTNLVNQWKAGRIAPIEGVKTEGDLMSGISKVDGWPGTKTLSSRFPTAQITIVTPEGKQVKDYGTDIGAYDKAQGITGSK